MLASINALLSKTVDYSGLFPPAKLSMQAAIANYLQYRKSNSRWMLGRFVLPASRLAEFETCLANISTDDIAKPWPLSAIVTDETIRDRELGQLREDLLSGSLHLSDTNIISLEFSPRSATEIERFLPHLPNGMDAFFEIPLSADFEMLLSVLRGSMACAKIRTGGVVEDAFPDTVRLGEFIVACTQAGIPFKATAGLHHPLPGSYPLTYELNSPSTAMQGFLTLAIAAAFACCQKASLNDVVQILQESSINSFQFKPHGIVWRDRHLSLAELKAARQLAFRSFGSCSFSEPIDTLTLYALLP